MSALAVRRRLPPALLALWLVGSAPVASAHPGHSHDPLDAANAPAQLQLPIPDGLADFAQANAPAACLTAATLAALASFAVIAKARFAPPIVAVLNGVGGGATTLAAWHALHHGAHRRPDTLVVLGLAVLLGAATTGGSLIALAKFGGVRGYKQPIRLFAQPLLIGILVIACLSLIAAMASNSNVTVQDSSFVAVLMLASILGGLLVSPSSGPDSPAVVLLMQSISGLAMAAAGFVGDNPLLLLVGLLGGAWGLILANVYCKSVNRSLANLLFGGVTRTKAIEEA